MCSMAAEALGPAGSVALLTAGLDGLAAEDLRSLSAVEQGRCIRNLLAQRNRMDAEISRRVAVFDRTGAYGVDGMHSAAAWLGREGHLAPNAASEQIRVARELVALPHVADAFAAGEVGFAHCATITRVLEDAPAEVVAEAEPELVAVARQTDPRQLKRRTRHLRHTFDPESVEAEAEHLHQRRRLHLSESMDGLYFIDGVLDPETGAMLQTALNSLMLPSSPDDRRTAPQRRHDALGDLLRLQLDRGELPVVGGQRPHLILTADIATLARLPGSRAADLAWGQPVPAETLRRVACDCAVTPIMVTEMGDPLSVGRTRRTFTSAQRRALVLRDKGCVLCGRPPQWTQAHHLRHWIEGGETSVRNGALVCHRCHRKLHEGGFQLVRKPDRTWAAIRPSLPP
ncbi:MAG TPA: DUF222 domain-containing protein [Candidatus Dormibacteraeota bacterium]|nr:DUF222 domain-containing protein [Candidatus Dormibacteraeota bacterium]